MVLTVHKMLLLLWHTITCKYIKLDLLNLLAHKLLLSVILMKVSVIIKHS